MNTITNLDTLVIPTDETVSTTPTLDALRAKYAPIDRTPQAKRPTMGTIMAKFIEDLLDQATNLQQAIAGSGYILSSKWIKTDPHDPTKYRVTPRTGSSNLVVNGQKIEATVADFAEALQFLWDVQLHFEHGNLDPAFKAELAKRVMVKA